MTSTVRDITQASIPVVFVTRGRPRLKGITDSIELFAVTQPAHRFSQAQRSGVGSGGRCDRGRGSDRRAGGHLCQRPRPAGVVRFAFNAAFRRILWGALHRRLQRGPRHRRRTPWQSVRSSWGATRRTSSSFPSRFLSTSRAGRHRGTRLTRSGCCATEVPVGDLYVARVDGVYTDACEVNAPSLVKDMTAQELVSFHQPADLPRRWRAAGDHHRRARRVRRRRHYSGGSVRGVLGRQGQVPCRGRRRALHGAPRPAHPSQRPSMSTARRSRSWPRATIRLDPSWPTRPSTTWPIASSTRSTSRSCSRSCPARRWPISPPG